MALARDQILQWITEHPNYTGAELYKVAPFERHSDREMLYRRIRDLEKAGCITRRKDGSGYHLKATGKPWPGRLKGPTAMLLEDREQMIQIMQEQDDRIVALAIARVAQDDRIDALEATRVSQDRRIVALEMALARLTLKLDPKP